MLKKAFGELAEILRRDRMRMEISGGCEDGGECGGYSKQTVAEIMFNYTIDTLRSLRERLYQTIESVREDAFDTSWTLQMEKTEEQIKQEQGAEYDYKGEKILLTGKEKEYYEVADACLDVALNRLLRVVDRMIEINEFVLWRIKEGKSLDDIAKEVEQMDAEAKGERRRRKAKKTQTDKEQTKEQTQQHKEDNTTKREKAK
ncbi:hypothetical protein DRP04_08415, partial [Archaeoglobales archaeon]